MSLYLFINCYFDISINYDYKNKVTYKMKEKQGNEIKQYKDFTMLTNIRKLTQEAINPVVKRQQQQQQSIQTQMTRLLADNQDLRRHMAKIEQVYKQNTDINKQITENHKRFIEYKDEQNYQKQKEQGNYTRILKQNQKSMVEMQSLKNSIQNQNQNIDSMKSKNQKMSALYSTLDARNQIALKNIQEKYHNFTAEILKENQRIKKFFEESSTHFQLINESLKRDKDSVSEKLKGLQLFQNERKSINDKFEDLYSKIILKINKDEFQGFRKIQDKYLQQQIGNINKILQESIPKNIRTVLPQMEKKLKELDKIEKNRKKIEQLEKKIQNTVELIERKQLQSAKQVQNLREKTEKDIQKMKNSLKKEMKLIMNKIEHNQKVLTERVIQVKKTIQSELQEKIQEKVQEKFEQEASEIHQTIQHEIITNQESRNQERDKQLQKQIEEIKAIKDNLISRSQVIEEVANSVQDKLDAYSNRITKIKSDYELFANNMRKEVQLAIKMKDKFSQNLSDVGNVLSAMAQFFLISGSLHYEALLQNPKYVNTHPNIHEVYVTNNDGIIYEFKTQNKVPKMIYRKQRVDPKHFVRSYMFSMVNYFDEIFIKYSFLNWKQHKPSQIFYSRCLDNYMMRMLKYSDHFKGAKSTNEIGKIMSEIENDEFHPAILQFTNHSRGAIHTSQSRKGLLYAQIQRNPHIQENSGPGLRKNYSIKKPKSSMEKTRYEQQYLSARSACRSKISQAT